VRAFERNGDTWCVRTPRRCDAVCIAPFVFGHIWSSVLSCRITIVLLQNTGRLGWTFERRVAFIYSLFVAPDKQILSTPSTTMTSGSSSSSSAEAKAVVAVSPIATTANIVTNITTTSDAVATAVTLPSVTAAAGVTTTPVAPVPIPTPPPKHFTTSQIEIVTRYFQHAVALNLQRDASSVSGPLSIPSSLFWHFLCLSDLVPDWAGLLDDSRQPLLSETHTDASASAVAVPAASTVSTVGRTGPASAADTGSRVASVPLSPARSSGDRAALASGSVSPAGTEDKARLDALALANMNATRQQAIHRAHLITEAYLAVRTQSCCCPLD
jgi:hypothetical protein